MISAERARIEIAALSERTHTTIALTTPALRDPEHSRSLALFPGSDEGQDWVRSGYPDISPTRVTTVIDATLDGATQDPRGTYVIFGDRAVADELTAIVRDWGLSVITVRYFSETSLGQWIMGSQFLGIILVTLALIALLSLGGAISGTRAYGILRLRGAGFGDLLRIDCRRYSRFIALALPLIAALGAIVLGFYNHFHRATAIGLCALWAVILALITLSLAHILGVAVAVQTTIPDAVSGKVTGGWVLGSIYLLRIPALLLLVVTAVSLTATLSQLSSVHALADSQGWLQADDASRVALNDRSVALGGEHSGPPGQQDSQLPNSRGHSEADPVGHWLRRETMRGNTVLVSWVPRTETAAPLTLPDRASATSDGTAGTAGVLVVDRAYAEDQRVLEAAGLGAEAVPPEGALLLVPPRLEPRREEILEHFLDDFDSVSGERDRARNLLSSVTAASAPEHHSYFLYGSGEGDAATHVSDVPVLILDNPIAVYTEESYAAAASTGALLLRHFPGALERASAAGASPYLLGIAPIGTQVALVRADTASAAHRTALTLVFIIAVVIASGMGLGRTYAVKHAPRLFVGYLRGRTAWQSASAFITGEATLAAAALGVSLVTTVTALNSGPVDEFGRPRSEPWSALAGGQPALVLGVLALSLTALILACARSYRRVTSAMTRELA